MTAGEVRKYPPDGIPALFARGKAICPPPICISTVARSKDIRACFSMLCTLRLCPCGPLVVLVLHETWGTRFTPCGPFVAYALLPPEPSFLAEWYRVACLLAYIPACLLVYMASRKYGDFCATRNRVDSGCGLKVT